MSTATDPIRVLHVDDDPAFVDLSEAVLEREDERIEVVTATSAAEGRDVLAGSRIDCVVSDYDMPGSDGIEFLKRVRETDPDLPFVLFTGKGSEEIASEAVSAGVTDYVQKEGGTDQYTILANRIENAVTAARTRERASRQERINTLLRDINRRLVAADSVAGIERAVTRGFADSDSYRFAWIGEPDPDEGSTEIVPRAFAGDAVAYLDEVTIHYDDRPRGQGPAGRAVRTGEMQLAQSIPDDPSFGPWHDVAERYGYESVAVLPLSIGDRLHGVLAIYADYPHAFDEEERGVLSELAETIGRSLEAAETSRRLETCRAAETARTERYYRTLADALPNGAVAFFDHDLRYTVVGGAVFDDLAVDPRDWEGETLASVHSSAFREAHLDHYRAALDGEERRFEFEYGDRAFEAHVAPVRDDDGTVVGGLAMSQDITARVRRRRKLERRERVLRELYEVVAATESSITERIRELVDVGVDALGVDYGILSQVRDDEYVFELIQASDGGHTIGEGENALSEGDAVPLAAANCELAVRSAETVIVEDAGDDPDLAERPPHADYGLSCYVGSAVTVDGSTYGTVCFYGDAPQPDGFDEWEVTLVDLLRRWVSGALSRRAANERLRARNERLQSFARIVSHDLRSPLSVAEGRLELAEETGDPEQFDRCRRAIDRIGSLVDDLSTIMTEGSSVEDPQPVALGRVATASWEVVETGEAALRVEDDATVLADEGRLRQLFENLIRNGVEHGSTSSRTRSASDDGVEHGATSSRPSADDGGRSNREAPDGPLTIRVGTLPDGDGIYVEDDGVGIPAAERDRVFEIGHSTAEGGTGLGLSIVERVASAHGWSVAVTEGRAGGTRIEVDGVTVE
jgi:signal transduction histidine kinase/CheY-like chemotaxis protein/putative methionine-R-sulfoxide reductase with GAF domain